MRRCIVFYCYSVGPQGLSRLSCSSPRGGVKLTISLSQNLPSNSPESFNLFAYIGNKRIDFSVFYSHIDKGYPRLDSSDVCYSQKCTRTSIDAFESIYFF